MVQEGVENGLNPAVASETTPLLGSDVETGRSDVENGARRDEESVREGLPEVAAKMHLILPALGIGIYLCAVDQLLTVATYAVIGNDLNALNNTSWIATAYFLTLTSFQPLYGKLSDIFGRKECLLFSYVTFGLGCLACGVSQNMVQLCIARAVAGIGGGGMNSLVSIVITDIVPLRNRGVWQGYINIIFAAGTSTGAPLGGLLADSVGWRWSFLGQVPFCIAAFAAVSMFLHLPKTDHAHWLHKVSRIDFLGALTLILSVVALLLGLDSGSNKGWAHPLTISSLSLFPVLAAAFLFVEMRVASHPFAPGHIIFEKSLFAMYAANFFGMAGQISPIFFAPLFFQAVMGLSATESGSLLIPCMVGAVMASIGGGVFFKRTGRYYWITVAGFAVLLSSVAPLMVGIHERSTAVVVGGLVLTAIGAGGGVTTTLMGLLSNTSPSDSAVVIACSYLFRSLGSSLGISFSSAVLQQTLRTQLAARLRDGDAAREIEERVRQSLDAIRDLDPAVAAEVRTSYMWGCWAAMVPTGGFLVLALLATFFVRERVLAK